MQRAVYLVTFDLVLTTAICLSIETSRSIVGLSGSATSSNFFWSFVKDARHRSIRPAMRVSSHGADSMLGLLCMISDICSRVCDMLSKSLAENKSASVRWSRSRLIVDVRAYAAGASLFLPMVIKKSDSNWKQLSTTLSTTRRDGE